MLLHFAKDIEPGQSLKTNIVQYDDICYIGFIWVFVPYIQMFFFVFFFVCAKVILKLGPRKLNYGQQLLLGFVPLKCLPYFSEQWRGQQIWGFPFEKWPQSLCYESRSWKRDKIQYFMLADAHVRLRFSSTPQ